MQGLECVRRSPRCLPHQARPASLLRPAESGVLGGPRWCVPPRARPPSPSNPSVSTHPRSCAVAAQGLLQTTLTDAGGAGGGGGGGVGGGTRGHSGPRAAWARVLLARRVGRKAGGTDCARVYARYGEATHYGPRSAPQDLARPRVLYGMVSDNAHVTLFDCQHTPQATPATTGTPNVFTSSLACVAPGGKVSRPPVAFRATSSESVATWSHGGEASGHRHAGWVGLEVSRHAPAARGR